MKTKILEVSIRGLQKDGLRFSVDTIAKELKISKKTVYKFFPSKEDLAVAVYEKFYEEIGKKIDGLSEKNINAVFPEWLDLYYTSYRMIREDVFNKFALNEAVKKLAAAKHGEVKNKFKAVLPTDDGEAVVFIIDGVFEKLNGRPLTPPIAEKLERLI